MTDTVPVRRQHKEDIRLVEDESKKWLLSPERKAQRRNVSMTG